MASYCLLRYPPSSFSFSSLNPKFARLLKPPHFRSISSQIQTPEHDDDDKEKSRNNHLDFLKLSVTLTVISASLPQPTALAGPGATVKGKKPRKSSTKKVEALSPEELKSWSEGLPVVSDRLPYSEIVELKRSGKLKHIIKPASAKLRQRAEAVLVVLDDSRVLRTVLPSFESDNKFWDSWDELKVDSLCMNTYTPPLKKPELPVPMLSRILIPPVVPKFWSSLVANRKPKRESKKVAELREFRMELQRQKKEELNTLREEREMMMRSMRIQKKEEDRRRKKEIRKRKYQESLREASNRSIEMADVWSDLANNPNVANALGLLFFYIFYRTVVLSYRKQKRDYEDRLKIEKADAEERKKMRELEREMEGLEGDDDDESQQGKEGEENAHMKMAKQFMKSGARVRRAQNKRLPQYLERGVDVKFSDVAGLGKIRLELEEIVKFFTHGEMYRRRGVKIPGLIYLNSDKLLAE